MAFTDYYVTIGGTNSAAAFAAATNPATPCSLTAAFSGANTGGIRVNVQSGLYSFLSAAPTLLVSGTSSSPAIFRGYANNPGDLSPSYTGTKLGGRVNGNGSLISTFYPVISFSGVAFLNNTNGNWTVWETLNFSTTYNATLGNLVELGQNTVAKSCIISGATLSTNLLNAQGAHSMVFDCDVYGSSVTGNQNGIVLNGASSVADSCRVNVLSSSTGAAGIALGAASALIFGNVVYISNGAKGIAWTVPIFNPFIRNNTIVGVSGDGISCPTGNAALTFIVGNCLTDNSGFGLNIGNSMTGAVFSAYNRYRNNTSGAIGNATDWQTATNYGIVNGGNSSDYNSPLNNDYRLLPTSPAVGTNWLLSSSIGAIQNPAAQQTSSASAS